MAAFEKPAISLRWDRLESSRLAWAFGISLGLHLLFFGTYQVGKKYGWWRDFHLPKWAQSRRMLTEVLKKPNAPVSQAPKEQQMMFLDVSPEQEAAEAPKEAVHYSNRNSKAANPEPQPVVESTVPKITGKETRFAKTEDVPRVKYVPAPPVAPPDPKPAPEEKPRPAEKPGDLAMAKPKPEPPKEAGAAEQARPRTLKEARARQEAAKPPGEKMKQEGGVNRRADNSAFDVKLTTNGAYDAAVIEAIRQRWYTLLDERSYASDTQGRVVLQFQLHSDGRVTDMSVAENSAGEVPGLLCQKAVLDPSPYAAWSNDMRKMLKSDECSVQFTFYYN
jgi:outer membrane biosynthesis protein TonB